MQDKIQEIMGLVESAIESAEWVEYEIRAGRDFDSERHKQDCRDIVFEIESKLRELVREPLSDEVAQKLWSETAHIDCESGGIALVRKVERAHQITNTSI